MFPTFDYDTDKSNTGLRWPKWLDRLENLFEAININGEEDDKRRRALPLHYVGDTVYDICQAEKGDTTDSYADTVKVLTDNFQPQTNIQMEIYRFRSCKQKEGQSLDEFVTELRQLAKNCEFADIDKELRRRALREPNKSLSDILELGRTLELADVQASTMERDSVNIVQKYRSSRHKQSHRRRHRPTHLRSNINYIPHTRSSQPHQFRDKNTCMFCGGDDQHKGDCPAKGKVCHYCKKTDHFKSVCFKLKKKETVNNLTQDQGACALQLEIDADSSSDDSTCSSDRDHYCYKVGKMGKHNTDSENHNTGKVKSPKVSVRINNVVTSILIDTGTSVNILDETLYQKLGKPRLMKGQSPTLYPYGGSKSLCVIWQCDTLVESKRKMQTHRFCVVKGNSGSLLGFHRT